MKSCQEGAAVCSVYCCSITNMNLGSVQAVSKNVRAEGKLTVFLLQVVKMRW